MNRISHIVKYRRFGRERWSPLEIGKVDPREMTVKEESVVRGGELFLSVGGFGVAFAALVGANSRRGVDPEKTHIFMINV